MDVVLANVDGTGEKILAKMPSNLNSGGYVTPAWSPDGTTLVVPDWKSSSERILYAIYKQITKFTTTILGSFAWSTDGKNLYVIRGSRSSDIVLLRDTK